MKKMTSAMAIALTLASAGSAIAAGSPPAYLPPPPTWAGFYIGVNAGYGWDASPNVYTAGFGGGGIDRYWANF